MNILIYLMAAILVILALVLIVTLVLFVAVLLMLRRTVVKVQKAVDDVEKTALRSLIPLMGIKNMFSDLEGFMNSVKAWSSMLMGKKSSKVDGVVKEKK